MNNFYRKLSKALKEDDEKLQSEDDWRNEYVYTIDDSAFKIIARNEDEAYRILIQAKLDASKNQMDLQTIINHISHEGEGVIPVRGELTNQPYQGDIPDPEI